MGFNYSTISPETAIVLRQKAEEINQLMKKAGDSFWRWGITVIGNTATKEQVANLISSQSDHEKDFILNCLDKVDKPWT